MSDTDAQIGKRLQELRGDMSQAALAAAMAERGHKWSQATVWSVEQGRRPMRLTEAGDVADILEVRVADLLKQDDYDRLWGGYLNHSRQWAEQLRALHEAAVDLETLGQITRSYRHRLRQFDRSKLSAGQIADLDLLVGPEDEDIEVPAWKSLREVMEEHREDVIAVAREELEQSRGVDPEAS
ncbi:hypothetical protein GCM10028787_10820 [Brachybacterium horti]